MQKDNEMFRQNYNMVLQEKEEYFDRNQQLENTLIEKDKVLKELQESMHSKESLIAMKDVEIQEMKEELMKAAQDKAERESKFNTLQEEHTVLQDSLKKINSLLENVRVELNQEKRQHMVLKEKVKKFTENPQNLEQSGNLLASETLSEGITNEGNDDNQQEGNETKTEDAIGG